MMRRLADLLSDRIELTGETGQIEITGLTADSRAIMPGMLFAALPGTNIDGARFAPEAAENGAAAIITGTDAVIDDLGIPVFRVKSPRRELALAAARFYDRQPAQIVAVTGTSGKTSVTVFTRQIWEAAGFSAASLGTIGLVTSSGRNEGGLTTPDPVTLHESLAGLVDEGITHLAIEASSHGLDQRRLDGLTINVAGFTNLSRDHLDYHASLDAYLAAKLRLIRKLLVAEGSVVFDADEPVSSDVVAAAEKRGLRTVSVGRAGRDLRIRSMTRVADGVRMIVEYDGDDHYVALPLIGGFQISNALISAGLAICTGVEAERALSSLGDLKGAPGRLERVGTHQSGAPVFVDYSHKPDALAKALQALRPHADRQLIVVFGAGGDRDPGKRALMGEAAYNNADRIIVTDDNPRSENPADIRREILQAAPGAIDIGDRREAIRTAVQNLVAGDVLVIAGKGHETGQIVGDQVLPFSDQDEVRAALDHNAGRA